MPEHAYELFTDKNVRLEVYEIGLNEDNILEISLESIRITIRLQSNNVFQFVCPNNKCSSGYCTIGQI